jgi:DNA polymerase-1
MKILLDADMFLFRACSAATQEAEWESGIHSYFASVEEAKHIFEENLTRTLETALDHHRYTGSYDLIFCLSDRDKNFRKEILATYKAHRKGQKPLCYWKLVEWLKEEAVTCQKDTLEADDCIGILATLPKNLDQCLIISGDKDLLTIPGYHYDFLRDTYSHISAEEADKNFLLQTLTGDPTDGYAGCPKVGKVSAEKILAEDPTWSAVVRAYEKAKLTEEDALVQARVARILRASDYDRMKKEVILWTPNGHP